MAKKISALGLDVGKKRLGVAGCDGLGWIATGLTTIYRTNFDRDLEELKKIVIERQVEILVVGLPYSMNGTEGFQARQVRKFARRISKALELPVEYVDERLTSVEAEERLKRSKRYSSRDKGAIDRVAAAIILQQWLDRRGS
ncbi:MAG: Holliday junction resolvase RuvX [Prochloraceae cyanobacterium]